MAKIGEDFISISARTLKAELQIFMKETDGQWKLFVIMYIDDLSIVSKKPKGLFRVLQSEPYSGDY